MSDLMPEIRAFLAIDIDDKIKPKLNEILKEFKKIDANIKFVDLLNMHLTLKFFGDIDLDGISPLTEKITSALEDFSPFNINIKGCGAFPNINHINVIWIEIEDDKLIKELHDRLDDEFAKLGFDRDKKFSSHLTIGRMKSAKEKSIVKSTIESLNDVEIASMSVKKITLKKSTLTPKGPIYENIKEFIL